MLFRSSSELLNQMSSNPILKELYNLAQQDDTFLEELNNIPKQKIILFCDVISSVTKEYQELIKLISRVKAFLKSSINLVDSVLLEDSTMVLINNTCNILNCERASLFIYDRFTDMLVLNTAEGLKKNEIKVPKDKGIVGSVFISGEKLKIDDAYHDVRFNKDVDKKTNFRTRNILCYPLKDKDGDTFGAIQAINKANGPFDTDDLELMEIFSAQASAILKNMMNMGETTTLISKMKILVQFSNEMYPISDIPASYPSGSWLRRRPPVTPPTATRLASPPARSVKFIIPATLPSIWKWAPWWAPRRRRTWCGSVPPPATW